MKVFETPSNLRGIPSESNKSELKGRTVESFSTTEADTERLQTAYPLNQPRHYRQGSYLK